MKIIIIATKNPKATCHPQNHQNISPRTPSNIMATSTSKQYSEKCHEQIIHSYCNILNKFKWINHVTALQSCKWRVWLAWGDGDSRKKCGEAAERNIGRFSLRGGWLEASAKWSFSLWNHLVIMLSKDRARWDEEVRAGFTSIGVTVAELRGVEDQGPICE